MNTVSKEHLLLLEKFANSSIENPQQCVSVIKNADDEESFRYLLYLGHLLYREKDKTAWVSQTGRELLGMDTPPNPTVKGYESFISTVFGGVLPDMDEYEVNVALRRAIRKNEEAERYAKIKKEREEHKRQFKEEREQRKKERRKTKQLEILRQISDREISAKILQGLIPGQYKETSYSEVFEGSDGFFYLMIPTEEFENRIWEYLEDRREQYFGIYYNSGQDERYYMLRTDEEIMAMPEALELIAINCFFISDDGCLAYQDSRYVIFKSSQNPML